MRVAVSIGSWRELEEKTVHPEVDAVAEYVRAENGFLITSHVNPDIDSIASQLAIASALSSLGKESVIVNEDPIPRWLEFLPGSEGLRCDLPAEAGIRVALVLDASDLDRLGWVGDVVRERALPIVNIDHHADNVSFGRLNLVQPHVSSTAEMLVGLISALGLEIGRERATCLYAGILGDTGSFRHPNTTSRVFRVVADLVDEGADPERVATGIYYSRSVGAVRLLGEMLRTFRESDDGRIGVLELTRGSFDSSGATMDESNGYATWALSTRGTEVGVLLRELENGRIRVSFRSTPEVDVGAIARSLGGGGHSTAAGCVLDGSLDEVRGLVLSRIRELEFV